MKPTLLTIAGSDPTGGAGLQADLRVAEALGCRGTSAVTAITVQDSDGVHDWKAVPVDLVRAQVAAVLRDLEPVAVKTGMLGTAEIVLAVARELRARPPRFVVVDPVLVSSSGYSLLEEDGVHPLCEELLPLATLVTPNLAEARRLSGLEIDTIDEAERAGAAIRARGAAAVAITGGHWKSAPIDVLVTAGGVTRFPAERVEGPDVHGTGCIFSAAVAAVLAKGASLEEGIAEAKRHTERTIRERLELAS